MGTWIEQLMDLTQRIESPRSFFYWSGLTAISAVVKNKVWINKAGVYKLYPNIYVMLVAESGLRKGYPVNLAKEIVQKVNNTRIISGRSSIQAIVNDISKPVKKDGYLITDASAYINSGEFSTSLVRDQDALTILTDLHDGYYNKEWKNTLKSTGTETLKNVNLTLLGAMNQTHFDDMISEKEISGGFIARCIIAAEGKRWVKNALLRHEPDINVDHLIEYLKEVSKLEGQMTIEEEGIVFFEKWYYDYEPENMKDKTGTANRVHDQILKVATLLSISRGIDKIITKKDIEEAIERLMITSSAVKRVTDVKGKSQLAAPTKMVLTDLLMAKDYTITRQKLLSNHYGDFDSIDLDRIIENFLQAKAIKVNRHGGDQIYTLTDRAIEAYEKNKQGDS